MIDNVIFLNMFGVLLIVSILPVNHPASAEQILASENASGSSLETYIVHVKLPGNGASDEPASLESWYHSFLPKSTTAGEKDSSRLVHTYCNVITGFAAMLSAEEVKEMEKTDGFLFARPQKRLSLQTTHSPNFLGLHTNFGVWPGSNFGEGVIIGVLDSGITPGHLSFDDEGMPPPPAKWNGKCEFDGMACNNKLIGARNFMKDFPGPPTDDVGHGTHTASTAGGNFVKDANLFGLANGTATGMAPRAHLAMYKVCTLVSCSDADILAAMDAAVEDGVDMLSLSLGGCVDN